MQNPKSIMYKFFDNKIQEVMLDYLEYFVKIHRDLTCTDEKIGFLTPPVDFSKLNQGDDILHDGETLVETFKRRNMNKPYRVQCFIGGVRSPHSLMIEFVPSSIPHITLDTQSTNPISIFKVNSEKYVNHLINNHIVDVKYSIGEGFKGNIRGIYALGKIFSKPRLEKMMNSFAPDQNWGGLSIILSMLQDVLSEEERSMVQEIQDIPKMINIFLQEWDSRIIDKVGFDKLQAQLSVIGLSVNNWLEN